MVAKVIVSGKSGEIKWILFNKSNLFRLSWWHVLLPVSHFQADSAAAVVVMSKYLIVQSDKNNDKSETW